MPRIPAMMTGTMFFMTCVGCMMPMDAMPTPALAVPYAAPRSGGGRGRLGRGRGGAGERVRMNERIDGRVGDAAQVRCGASPPEVGGAPAFRRPGALPRELTRKHQRGRDAHEPKERGCSRGCARGGAAREGGGREQARVRDGGGDGGGPAARPNRPAPRLGDARAARGRPTTHRCWGTARWTAGGGPSRRPGLQRGGGSLCWLSRPATRISGLD